MAGINVVEIERILPTNIWIESDFVGGRSVMIQHEGCEAFEYARFNYHHFYTSNSGTQKAAEALAISLGAVAPIEHRNRKFNNPKES